MIRFQDLLAQKEGIDRQAAQQLTPEDLNARYLAGQQTAGTDRAQQMGGFDPTGGASVTPPEELNTQFQAGQVENEARRAGAMNSLLPKKLGPNFNRLMS